MRNRNLTGKPRLGRAFQKPYQLSLFDTKFEIAFVSFKSALARFVKVHHPLLFNQQAKTLEANLKAVHKAIFEGKEGAK